MGPGHIRGVGILSRPLLSSPTADGWACTAGYYRTPSAQHPTCRACAPLARADCLAAELYQECTPDSDSRCAPCAPLPRSLAYVPRFNDCQVCPSAFLREARVTVGGQVVRCADAYYNNASRSQVYGLLQPSLALKCEACPIGAFCANGSQTTCPNQTTSAPGATSPLQCVPTAAGAQMQFQISVLFTVKGDAAQCPNLAQVLVSWLRYGEAVGCFLGTANYSQNVGGVQCIVGAARAYAELYLSWLTDALTQERAWMQLFLLACLRRPELVITDVSVLPLASGGAEMVVQNASAPQLLYEVVPWGRAQRDVVSFLLSAVLLASSLVLSLGFLCSGLLLSG